jgi:hypothetical protein
MSDDLLRRTRCSVYVEDAVTAQVIRQYTRMGVDLEVAINWTAHLVRTAMRSWRERQEWPS